MRVRQATWIFLLLTAFASLPALADGPFQYYPLTPCRVFDTRNVGSQTNGNPLPQAVTAFFRLQGNCGIPNTAKAVSLNLTIVSPTSSGDMRLYPKNITPGLNDPSTINYGFNDVLANGAILPVAPVSQSTDKDIQIVIGMPGTGHTVHAIIDVTGYYQQ
jgi:hypothetical protein